MSPPAVHAATEKARRVVGLYGDPTITWAIGLVADLHAPADRAAVGSRLADLVARYPDLGVAPRVECVPREEFDAAVDGDLNTPFDGSGRLLRVTLSDDGAQLAFVAHHGVVDGLGLLCVLGSSLGAEATTLSRGIGHASSRTTFARSALTRVWEALFVPPSRLAPDVVGRRAGDVIRRRGAINARRGDARRVDARRGVARRGDVTAVRSVATVKTDTAAIAAAAVHVMTQWNRSHGRACRRIVVAIGASRRANDQLRPDRETAYLRVGLAPGTTAEQARDALRRTAPEPDFPAASSRQRFGRLVVRLLRNRLGSSLLVSNLGLAANLDAVAGLAFYPAAGGGRAASIGVASTNHTTSVTVRLARSSYSELAAQTVCRDLVSSLTSDHNQ